MRGLPPRTDVWPRGERPLLLGILTGFGWIFTQLCWAQGQGWLKEPLSVEDWAGLGWAVLGLAGRFGLRLEM